MKKLLLFSFILISFHPESVQAQFLGGQLKSGNSPFPPGTVHCNPQNRTAVVEVTNPVTGKIWMDRNLGAERVATSSTDAEGELTGINVEILEPEQQSAPWINRVMMILF